MQHQASTELNDFIDYSSFNDSINFEEYFTNKNDNQLTLTKLFALLRTWNKSVHDNFAKLILLILEKEININEYDVVTGMNLLHFTCKFGAKQIGHEQDAIQIMNILIDKGINLSASCLWMQMNCLHYCAFFDSSSICELLLKQSKVLSLLNQPCFSFKNSSPLHLACATLSLSTAEILLKAGANKNILDDQQRTPSDCIPTMNNDEQQQQIAETLRALLPDQESEEQQQSLLLDSTISNSEHQPTTTMQFQQGERIRLTNNKIGTVRYFGSVPFGVNLWYGIELDEPYGKHDGCVGGIRYFTCAENKGIFVQPSFLQKLTPVPHSPERERRFRPINFPLPDTSAISSRIDSGLRRDSSADGRGMEQYQVTERVSLSKNRSGTVKYVGPTLLGSGIWYGIELDSSDGLHDGCLNADGPRYFQCKPQHGIFVRGFNLKKLNTSDQQSQSMMDSFDHVSKRNSRMVVSDYDPRMMSSSIIDNDSFSKSTSSGIQSMTFQVGDKVYCHNHAAIVRFIGTTLFSDGIWIGIEFLSGALGKNDGSVNGHVYFQCKQNYGLFIRPNRLTLTKK
ncbi:unnamed protein product [Adineta steineri]|uniref:CAP-Gly domain-containing protein n=1 Tax=Adineta steineri TaxID=433720 RepID=A0A818QG36_9BILA|nr:unnamed protein product [Adineta steineri]